jgi:hypothetical protein
LFVKGKHAWEYDWLWRQPEEQCYYKELYLRRDHSAFANSVTFDPFGDDVAIWLSKIGFVLSTSDHEGSHQAVAEGMASGAIPIIRNWKGADAIYPPKYVFRTADEAVELILKWNTTGNYLQEYTECKNLARQKFDQALIIQQVRKLFAQLLAPMVIGAEK